MQENTQTPDGSLWCCGKLFYAERVNGRVQLECSQCGGNWIIGPNGIPSQLRNGPNLHLVPRTDLAHVVPLIPGARNGNVTLKNKLA